MNQDPRVLVVSYEELKSNFRQGLAKIASHCDFILDPAEVDVIEVRCSFQYMSTNREKFEPISVRWRDPAFRFIRKGQVSHPKDPSK